MPGRRLSTTGEAQRILPVAPVRQREGHRRAPTKEAWTARFLLIAIPSTLILLAIVTRLVVTSDWVSRSIATSVAAQIANRGRVSVQLSGVSFKWNFAPCFHDLEIYRFNGPFRLKVASEEACIERWASALGSGFHAVTVGLKRPYIELVGASEEREQAPFVDVKPSTGKKKKAARGTLREIQISFDDLRFEWDKLPVPARFAQGSFGPIDGTVTLQSRARRSAATIAIREPATGSKVNGRITPTGDGYDFSAGVEGDLVPIFGGFFADSRLDVRQLPSKGRVGAKYVAKTKRVTIDVDMSQDNVDLANRKIAKTRLTGFSAREKARIEINLEARRLALEGGIIEINGIPVVFSLRLAAGRTSPEFFATAALKSTSMLRLLRSAPGADEPEFAKNMSPSILFAASASVQGELKNPETWEPKFEYSMQGLDEPGVVTGLEYLAGTFEYFPLTKKGRSDTGIVTGPGTESWVPYKKIPYVQRRAIIVSEDANFPFHRGVDIAEVKNAIQESMKTQKRARGGSTLSQQLVKNLFLSRDRTALRKIQELLITLHVESVLDKEQIFELYANLIEWGPNLWGLNAATQHYFNRRPQRINPVEMGYLASIITNPVYYHEHYEQGYVPKKHMRGVRKLLETLNRLKQLKDPDFERSKEQRVRFVRRRKEN